MMNRLTGTGLRVRVGIGVAMLSGALGYTIADGWNVVNVAVALFLGAAAGYFTPDVGKSIDPRT